MADIIGEFENETRNKEEYETKYIEWRIPDIFGLDELKEFISPHFSTTDDYSEWNLALYYKQDSKFFAVDIQNDGKCEYSVEYFFGLKKNDGTVKNCAYGTLEGGLCECEDWCDLIKKEKLLFRKAEFAPSDILTVTCTLKWRPGVIHSPEPAVSEKEKSLKLTRLDTLSANFKGLYADKETCDLTLKVQDQEFKAHSQVLMARSSVFSATFKHDTLEKQTGVITIPDCDPHSFQEFLEYLYSGELKELSLNSALNLYYTSNK